MRDVRFARFANAHANAGIAGARAAMPSFSARLGSGARTLRWPLALALVLVAMLSFSVALASAAVTHPYTGVSFGPDGVGGTESFEKVVSVAVAQGSGDVYVLDGRAAKVYKFDAAGKPSNFSVIGSNVIENVGGFGYGAEEQLAVAPPGALGGTAGDIYVANAQGLVIYAADGSKLGEISEHSVCGVGTDPAGNLYLGLESGKLLKLTPSENPPSAGDVTDERVIQPELPACNVAASSSAIYSVVPSFDPALFKLKTFQGPTETLLQESLITVAVEPSTGNLLANQRDHVNFFNDAGELIDKFGRRVLKGESYGVAANGAGRVFVGNEDKVAIFGAPTASPEGKVEDATEVGVSRAQLNGSVNPDGQTITSCEFEYESEGVVSSATCQGSLPADHSDHPVTAQLTGLSPHSFYLVRLVLKFSGGTVYSATDSEFTTSATAQTKPATEITGTSAKLNGSISPEGATLTACTFEYGETEAYDQEIPCVGAIPADEAAHAVSASISGLRVGGNLYHYRVVIHNGGETFAGFDETFQTKGASIERETTRSVGSTEALVEARLNPRGPEASYFVEWGETSTYGNRTDEAFLEAGEEPLPQQLVIAGLQPNTIYHFRFVAIDEFGETEGPDRTFTTFPAGETGSSCPNETFRTVSGSWLANCRAFEQITPTEKSGGQAEAVFTLLQAAPNGESMTLASQAGLPGGQGAQDFPSFISVKHGESWSLKGLLPPASVGEEAFYLGMSVDTKTIVTEAGEPGLGYGIFAQDRESGEIKTVVPYQPKHTCGFGPCVVLVGGSADGSVLILESRLPLTNEPISGQTQVYAWYRSTGETKLVGVDEADARLKGGAIAGPYNWYNGDFEGGGVLQHMYDATVNGVSPNGNVVFYTAAQGDQLYMRTGIVSGNPHTVRLSASQRTVGETEEDLPAIFLAASEDGKRALLMSQQKLTNDATTGPFDEGRDLYSYDAETGDLTDLVPDTEDENGARVQGVLGASSDARSIYFVALGDLAEGGVTGQNNLYHYFESAGQPHIVFVKRLAEGGFGGLGFNDSSDWSPLAIETGSNTGAPRTARVSANGSSVVFTSVLPEEGFDNRKPGCLSSGENSEPCHEVFFYSAQTNRVHCISCNTTGTRVEGSAGLQTEFINAFTGGGGTLPARLSHNVSADGTKVFFETPDALKGRDVNGKKGCSFAAGGYGSSCQDVYQWEIAGTPDCPTAEANGGCLSIVSSGQETGSSFFGEADPSAKNVFIFTASQLVPADRDQLYDVYDASEEGGLASQYAAPPNPCTSQPACGGPTVAPTPTATPGTSTFIGPGNPTPKAKLCPKGGKTKGAKKCKKHKKHRKGAQTRSGNKADKGGSK